MLTYLLRSIKSRRYIRQCCYILQWHLDCRQCQWKGNIGNDVQKLLLPSTKDGGCFTSRRDHSINGRCFKALASFLKQMQWVFLVLTSIIQCIVYRRIWMPHRLQIWWGKFDWVGSYFHSFFCNRNVSNNFYFLEDIQGRTLVYTNNSLCCILDVPDNLLSSQLPFLLSSHVMG